MKLLVLSRGVLILLSLWILAGGCRKEPLPSGTMEDQHALTPDRAKDWFHAKQQQISDYRIAIARKGTPKAILKYDQFKPQWGKIKQWKTSGEARILEIPIQTVRPLALHIDIESSPDSEGKHKHEKERQPTRNFARLVMAKDLRGRIQAAVMEVIGLDSYVENSHYNLAQNNFLRVDSLFSGIVIFKDFPTGEFMWGYRYVNGRKTGKVSYHLSNSRLNYQRMNANCSFPIVGTEWACGSFVAEDGVFTSECTPVTVINGYIEYNCGEGGNSFGENSNSSETTHVGGAGGGGIPADYPKSGKDLPNLLDVEKIQEYIKNKPFALLPDTIPCSTIKKWLSLAEYQPDNAIIRKLNTILATKTAPSGVGGPGFTYEDVAHVQDINNAYSSVVNMDYFAVKVNTLPVVNGVRLTADQFLQYIRKNINNFVNTNLAKFSPYKYGNTDDTNLWNSGDPAGAIVSIDIPFNDGSVITSYSSNNRWTFTTIHDPFNGEHPVSGNRNFGYTINMDGSYTFYTQGVDRLTDAITTYVQKGTGFPFNQADSLWTSFQDKMEYFVNYHNGNGEINKPLKYRPHWQDVKDVLDSKKSLSTLSKLCPN